jgi:hypothetical protein
MGVVGNYTSSLDWMFVSSHRVVVDKELNFFLQVSCYSSMMGQFMLHLNQGETMTIQSSVQIGYVIRNAVSFNVKNWRGGTMNSDSLIQDVQELFAILEQRKINYVLVGGIALLHYIEGRNTQDLDLIMASSSLKRIPELQISNRDIYFVHANYGGLHIDILLTNNLLFRQVKRKWSKQQNFFDREIPIATVEGLLLLKLYALPSLYRQGDFSKVGIYENDIATLIHYFQPDMAFLLNELSHYLGDHDFTEIKSIMAEIQNRINRFKNGSR